MGKGFNPRQILRIACCHQCQAIDCAPHIITERFVCEHLACFIKNEFGLRAVKRSSCRVGTHNPKFELHFFGFALPPNEKVQLPLIGFFFCVLNCKSNAFAGIISKGFAINAKYHIINFNNAICRRFSTYMSDKNLPTESGSSTLLAFEKIRRLGVNPTTQSGCTKVVSQLGISRLFFCKIRRNRVFGLGKSLLAGNKQNN